MTDAKGKKILIIDDEKSIRTYLETLLQDNGYETVTANDGIEGMEKVNSEKPDLVALDISMPEQSGVRCYRDIKENSETTSLPVIIVTGVTGWGGKPEEFQKFISSRKQIPPPDGFIAKPIDQEEFLAAVAKVLV